MNEFGTFDPTISEKTDETPEIEEKEGAVEAFGRRLIDDAKICQELAEYVKQNQNTEIGRVSSTPELKKIVVRHSNEKNFYSTLGRTQEALEKINTAREAIKDRIIEAKEKSETSGEPWENILVKKFFGLEKIEGEIEIIDSDFYITFVTNTFADFASMHSGGAEAAADAAGYSFTFGDMPYTVVNKIEDNEVLEGIHSHEEQHILNSLVLERAESELHYRYSDFQKLLDKKAIPSRDELEQAVANTYIDAFAVRTKDEILAYYRDSQPNEALADALTDLNLLSYYEIGMDNDKALFELEIQKEGLLSRGTMTNDEHLHAIMELTEAAYEQARPTIESWVQDAEKIIKTLEKTEKRQDIIFMLGLVPIKKWSRIAKVFEKIEQNRHVKTETNKDDFRGDENDLSLEMIKSEVLIRETLNS